MAFSSASLLASFSFNCLSVSVAIFLSCNTSFESHFIVHLGVSSLTILSILISSLSGTFCLCFLSSVLGFIYVVPPQSWGDRSDTKHSKCLLLGGRRLNQLTLIPKPKGSGGARAATAQVGPANNRNDTKRCLPVEASLRPGEAVPW